MSTAAPEALHTLTPEPPRRPRRRWPRVLLGLAVLFAAAVWFAPAVVANTGLRTWVARKALADLKGTVDVGGASLGWFSPVVLRGVSITDAAGRPLLAVPSITSTKSLAALLRDQADVGEFVFERPTANVVCEKLGTNLEEALAEYLKSSDEPAKRVAVAVRVVDGTVTLHDADDGKTWTLTGVDVAAAVPASAADPVTARVKAAVAGPSSPGFLDADVTVGAAGKVVLKADGFPLEAAGPLVRRAQPGIAVGGRLKADLAAAWGTDPAGKPTVKVDGTAAVTDFDLAGPWLRGDRLKLASVEIPVKLEAAGSTFVVEKASLTCDLGTASASGTLDHSQDVDALLDRAGVAVTADLDLAAVARLLPRFTRLRPGTEVREGKVSLSLASKETPAGTAWAGDLRTSALKAVRDGKAVEWAEPLAVQFSGRLPAGHLPTFDKFVCRSDFLALNAAGSAESLKASVNVYLDRLAARLGEFADLGDLKLAGRAEGWVKIDRTPATGGFKAESLVTLTDFAFTDGPGRGLREAKLTLKADAAGRFAVGSPARLDAAILTVVAAEDGLEVKLLEPVADLKALTAGKASVRLVGDLGRWKDRAAGVAPVPAGWQVGGVGVASGTVRFAGPERVAVDGLKVDVDRARFRGAGFDLAEPKLTAEGDVAVNPATGAVELAHFRVTSQSLTLVTDRLTAGRRPTGEYAADGTGTLDADLNGLQRLLGMQADSKGGDAVHGRAAGTFTFAAAGGKSTFATDLDAKDFAYGPKASPLWAEPRLKLAANGELDPAADAVRVTSARVERDGLAVDATGSLSRLSTAGPDVTLNGTLRYDLAKLSPQVRAMIGGGFEATGQGAKPFTLAGSLAPGAAPLAVAVGTPGPVPAAGGVSLAALTGNANVAWQSASAYGFDVGPADLNAHLARGVLTARPIEATFGGGKVRLAPTVTLEPGPSVVTFEKGTVVDRAKLTPKACASAIGFALPVIAKATRAEGDISFILDDNRVPLLDPTKANVKGRLVVHKASVGAGPVVGEIAKLLGAAATTVTLADEMTVPVRVENGRVHHENLRLTVNSFAVTTNGSVGFDGSLSLVVDVPLTGKLLGGTPMVQAALKGKTVRVPVGGTVDKPALDGRAFEAAAAGLAREAAKDVGKELIKGGLDKLLTPKK